MSLPSSHGTDSSAITDVPWWGRISTPWLCTVPVISLIYALALPLLPNDLWFHLRAGAIIAETGHIPTTNIFSAGLPPDAPYFYQNWLAEWLMYQLLRLGGPEAIMVARGLLTGLAFAIVTIATYRHCLRLVPGPSHEGGLTPPRLAHQTNAARCTTVAMLAAFMMSATNLEARPQMFSLPLFALFVAALLEWRTASSCLRSGFLIVLPLGMAAWVNLHGAFFTALLMLGVAAAMATLTERRAYPGLAGLWLLTGLCFAASLLNPRGPGIYTYLVGMSTNTAVSKFTTEWQRPGLDQWHYIVFYASPLVLALLVVVNLLRLYKGKSQISPADCGGYAGTLLPMLLLLAIACRSLRAILWFALLLPPHLAAVLLQLTTAREQRERIWPPLPGPALWRFNAACLMILALLAVPALPQMKCLLPWPEEFINHFAPTPRAPWPGGFPGSAPMLFDRTTPVEATEYLREHPPNGPVFSNLEAGSYITWALYPRVLTAIESRIEMYPTKFWLDYLHIYKGAPNSAELLTQKGYGAVLLDRKEQKLLTERLVASPQWTLVFKGRGEDKSMLWIPINNSKK